MAVGTGSREGSIACPWLSPTVGAIGGWLDVGVSLRDAMLVAPLGGEGGRCFSDVCNAGFSDARRGDLSCRGVDNICPDSGDPVDEAECV